VPDFDWWWRLLDPVYGTVFRAAATRSAFAGDPSLPIEPPLLGAGVLGAMVWTHDVPEYQPYLRLT
jgi:hypothetical protein